jgi:hypothetical protein
MINAACDPERRRSRPKRAMRSPRSGAGAAPRSAKARTKIARRVPMLPYLMPIPAARAYGSISSTGL